MQKFVYALIFCKYYVISIVFSRLLANCQSGERKKMASNKKKREKSNNKVSRFVKKDVKSVSKIDRSGAKAAEYVVNLLELHKLQGVLLRKLHEEF